LAIKELEFRQEKIIEFIVYLINNKSNIILDEILIKLNLNKEENKNEKKNNNDIFYFFEKVKKYFKNKFN
jgi:hypothetical protein